MARPNMQSCPICQEELEEGYLSFLGYLKWCETEPSSWHGFQGEWLAGRSMGMRNRSTKALKCTKCDLLFFGSDYPKDEK